MSSGGRSAQEWALELAHRGFLIFPLRRGTKEPFEGSWTSIMTADEETIRWWFDERPGMNYGVCPGPEHVIIDLDVKEQANGLEAFGLLELENGELDTFTVESPSGGRHLYLSVDTPASNAHRFPKGIDIRGAHGYVVGPGCEIIEGECKVSDTPGTYSVVSNRPVSNAPDWITDNLKRKVEVEDRSQLFELDDANAISRAREFIQHRDPAIEGLGGDHHTLVTAMCLIDFGLSEEKVLELLTDPFLKDGESEERSWNDRCVPPWDVNGRKGTLEEKVKNAWRYRERDIGSKGGGATFDEDWLREATDIATMNAQEGHEGRFARIRDHLFRGGAMFGRGKRREFIIPEWLPAHGMVANLARRGGGKTVVMIDMALRIANDMDWHGQEVKPGFHVVYLCGEDDEGAEEQVRAWCQMHGVEHPPQRFIFLDIITDLMSADDTREYAEALKAEIGQNGRAVVFLDTWQRASSRGGQNKDEDMQLAVFHAEALARSLDGPAVVAFHPPKHNEEFVMGSSVIENATTAIWRMSDHAAGRKLEVTRIKGKGVGNYQMFKFEEIGLGEEDEFGKERTGIVPIRLGGVEGEPGEADEGEYLARKAFAIVLRELEVRRKDEDPNSTKHYATTKAAKIIAEELPDLEANGDEWAENLLNTLRDAGTVNIRSWKRINERITELLTDDPRGYDFGDGFALRVYRDGNSRRIRIDKSGLALDNDDNI